MCCVNVCEYICVSVSLNLCVCVCVYVSFPVCVCVRVKVPKRKIIVPIAARGLPKHALTTRVMFGRVGGRSDAIMMMMRWFICFSFTTPCPLSRDFFAPPPPIGNRSKIFPILSFGAENNFLQKAINRYSHPTKSPKTRNFSLLFRKDREDEN